MGIFRRRDNAAAAEQEQRGLVNLSDPAAASALLGWGVSNYSGEFVNESSALALSSVWRAVNSIASQLAAIPMHTYTTNPDGTRERGTSFLDNPAGPDGTTTFEWVETVALHMLLHGESFLLHLYNAAGAIIGLLPVHPLAVTVERAKGVPEGKLFKVGLTDGQQLTATTKDMCHVVGPSLDGLRGMNPLRFAANSLGTALAGDKSAATMFSKGALVSGVLTPAPDQMLTAEDVEAIQADLQQYLYGSANAGGIPIINRVLQFSSWAQNNADAQWLETRNFSVSEIARWYGIPLHMLFVPGATSNWGSGISEQNKNFAQFVLVPWGQRLTERLSRLIRAKGTFVAFDFAGLERGSAKDTSDLLLAQVNGGILTANEARRVLDRPPVDGGDELRIPSGVMLSAQLEAAASEPTDEEPAP